MRARLIQLSLLLVLASLLLIQQADAQYQVYYRMFGEPRPGSELIIQFALSREGDEVRPIGDTDFRIWVEGEAAPRVLKSDKAGVVEVRVKVPMSLIFGGKVRIKAEAYSEFYGVKAEKMIEVSVAPDHLGVMCCLLASFSVLIPIVAALRRLGE